MLGHGVLVNEWTHLLDGSSNVFGVDKCNHTLRSYVERFTQIFVANSR
jgi:hypothetical protein